MKHHILPVLVWFLLAGCSTSPSGEHKAAPDASITEAQINDKQIPNTIKTSQGEITITPTVVSNDVVTAQELEDDSHAAHSQYNDPFEAWNRKVFAFNHYLYSYALIPTAKGYNKAVPVYARDKIGNVFDNVREPLNLLSNLASGKFRNSTRNLGRFLINSTLGLAGLFDPADDWLNIKPSVRNISNTLATYDVAAGPFLVLPILGQNDIRSTTSLVTEGFIHPIAQLTDSPETFYIRGFDGFQDVTPQLEAYEKLYKQSEDPYIYFRNQYIQGQHRNVEVLKAKESQ